MTEIFTSLAPAARVRLGFLAAGGACGALILARDWSRSPLGSVGTWPPSLTSALRLVLPAKVPMALLWGPESVLLYNNAYAAVAGPRHPDILGSTIIEGWPEIAEFNRNVVQAVLRGETLRYRNVELILARHGPPEPAYFDLDYSPVLDDDDRPAGVLAVVAETTAKVVAESALQESEARAREDAERVQIALDAGAIVGTWDWDVPADRFTADRRFAHSFDLDVEACRRGLSLDQVVESVHPDDLPGLRTVIQNALVRGGSYSHQYRVRQRGGDFRWIEAHGQVELGPDGSALRFPGVLTDIEAHRAVETALAESEARFTAIVNSIDQMIWSTRPDGFHDYYNARWYEYTGVPKGSTDGEAWNGMFHADDQDRAWEVWRRCLATGQPYHIEYRLRHRSGEYRWVIGRAQPVRDGAGKIVRWYGTCTDIHDLKAAEEARELIASELSHRVKNTFALVSGLVRLAAREDPTARPFAMGLQARIDALARAHDFVRRAPAQAPDGQTAHGLVEQLLAPYHGRGVSRVVLSGDDVAIGPQTAIGLALILHEAATNAAKYGALSVEGGRVLITTQVTADCLKVIWQEQNGPAVTGPPAHQGFGTLLSERVATTQLDATFRREWLHEGLTLTLEMPLADVGR